MRISALFFPTTAVDADGGGGHRDLEAEFLANQSSSLTQGTTWERIAALIELENSQSKTIARAGAGMVFLFLNPSVVNQCCRHDGFDTIQRSPPAAEERGKCCTWS